MELCVKCRINLTENKNHRCVDCGRKYYKEFYSKRKALGLCTSCHRKNDSDRLMCDVCVIRAKRAQNDRRMRAKRNFLCVVIRCSLK